MRIEHRELPAIRVAIVHSRASSRRRRGARRGAPTRPETRGRHSQLDTVLPDKLNQSRRLDHVSDALSDLCRLKTLDNI